MSGGSGLTFQGNQGGGLFRIGLTVAGPLAQHFVPHQHLNGKDWLVVGALRRDQFVMGSGPAHALNQLLQAGLGVIDGPAQAPNAVKVRLKSPENKVASRIVSLIQVDGRNQGLKGLLKDGLSVVPPGLHFTFSQ